MTSNLITPTEPDDTEYYFVIMTFTSRNTQMGTMRCVGLLYKPLMHAYVLKLTAVTK